MKWFRIPKESSPRPQNGNYYYQWKEHLSYESKQQCVYCAININSFGGIRNFHVEHYKPKARNKFPELENDYNNLFFACSICNCFKSDDWPNEPSPKLDNSSFPDPSKVDYSDILSYNNQLLVESKYITGKYIIQKLFLNRPQLVLERKGFYLNQELVVESEKLKEIGVQLKKKYGSNPMIDSMITMINTTILLIQGKYINPYTADQIER
jgi:hypothetical protein